MKHLNKQNNRYVITAATIFTLAIIGATSRMMMTAPAEATTTTAETATPASSSGLELSPQPVYIERSRTVSENLINETHMETTFTTNGTLNLPDGTEETINTTGTGTTLLSIVDSTAIGRSVITTEDGSESATAKFFGIARFNMEEEGSGRGIVIAVVHTNSTGRLAPLDVMILAGQGELAPDGTSLLTLWEWQNGIPLPTATTTPEETPLMNTTMTNTTAADTNAIEAATEEEGEGNEGEGENPDEFEDCIVPPGREPGDVGC
jgi:hypothetical protein